MNIKQAQTIPIVDLLAHFGHFPVRSYDNGREYTYFSPFRPNENTASFDVNIEKNLACDRGMDNMGGDSVRIVQMLHKTSVSGALDIIEKTGLYRGQANYVMTTPPLRKSAITKNASRKSKNYSISSELGETNQENSELVIDSFQELQHPLLIQYVKYRCINVEIAKAHGLKEINYHYSNNPDNQYFALAWQDDLGGYEMNRRGAHRSFKGCIGAKSITSIINPHADKLAIFESYLDFLSYLTYFKITNYQSSAIILNGTGQVEQALKLINSLKDTVNEIYLFLDNDEAGENAKHHIINSSMLENCEVKDKSNLYVNYKDFNCFLILKGFIIICSGVLRKIM